jgi:hypothetical protein
MAGPYYDQASVVAIEKTLYDDQRCRDMAYKNNPDWALTKKKTDVGGSNYPMPIIVSPGQGGGAQFNIAQASQTPAQTASFQLVNLPYYGLGTIMRQTILSMKTDKMAFINALELATNSALSDISNSMACFKFRDGTGTVGTISTITSGVVQLTNPSDSVFFERRRNIQANATSGGATPRAQNGFVIAVNRQLGQVTFSMTLDGPAATPTGWQAGDSLLRNGDNNAVPPGYAAWLPVTAPSTSDSFLGVNRSPDTRLYGVLGAFASESISEAAVDHAQLINREGGVPKKWILNPTSWGALVKELGSKVQYIPVKAEDADISFDGVQVHSAEGPITALQDRSCQPLTGFMLQEDTWEVVSIGDAPHIQGLDDGEEFFRVYNQDARELRTSAYWSVGSGAPGWSGQTQLQQ